LGPHLLHDAVTAAAYRNGVEGVASISRATDVNGLRQANGPYRILPTREAADYMRCGHALPLAPLCGGVPPAVAWPYLERAAEAAARGGLSKEKHAGKPKPRRGVVDRGRRLHRRRRRAPAPGSRARRRVGALAGQGRPRRR